MWVMHIFQIKCTTFRDPKYIQKQLFQVYLKWIISVTLKLRMLLPLQLLHMIYTESRPRKWQAELLVN